MAKIDERLFSQANEFIPERWTTRPKMARDPAAFVPFSMGKHLNPTSYLADQHAATRADEVVP
ncbi:cytochrome p450 [Colletotrichum tofieldiae]|nr:cytochrome P450 [Colletotrichum tofieldiae]GKT72716.1 cytochrome p450 [Colletotrichum tofieldiae]GKT89443.1 cytochrome P450 [Colletotrichum tofieldiae]